MGEWLELYELIDEIFATSTVTRTIAVTCMNPDQSATCLRPSTPLLGYDQKR